MTDEIVSASNQIAKIGNNEISLQVLQDIYHSVTGNTEVATRLFHDAHQVTLADFERLHRDFGKCVEQYHCHLSQCNIAARYCDGKTDKFSGFNRFKLDGVSNTSPTESIEFEYNFLVLLPKTKEAKPYKVVVGVRSTLGVVQRMAETKASEPEKNLFYAFERGTARMEIHYVDRAVARSLEALVEEWYKSLRKEKDSMIMKAKKSVSPSVPAIFKSTVIVFTAFALIYFLDKEISTGSGLFRLGIGSAAALMMAYAIATPVSNYVKIQLDRTINHSTILLSDADKRLKADEAGTLLRVAARTLFGWISTIAGALFIAKLTSMVGL